MSQFSDEPIIDVERRTKEIGKILGDPTLFPVDFLNWLKRYIEQSGITLPASAIIGGFKPGAGSVRNLAPGLILPFGGGSPPSGALLCDGASYLRANYPLLFAEVGTTWGAVDGSTFNVPDLRGRALYGVDGALGLGNVDGRATGNRGPTHHHAAGTLGTNTTGSHSHGGGTGGAGGHDHSLGVTLANAINAADSAMAIPTTSGSGTFFTSAVGDHSHGIGSDGSHSHTVSGNTSGGGGQDTPGYAVVLYVITTGQ